MPARVTFVVPSAFWNLASDQPVTPVRCALVRHGQSDDAASPRRRAGSRATAKGDEMKAHCLTTRAVSLKLCSALGPQGGWQNEPKHGIDGKKLKRFFVPYYTRTCLQTNANEMETSRPGPWVRAGDNGSAWLVPGHPRHTVEGRGPGPSVSFPPQDHSPKKAISRRP